MNEFVPGALQRLRAADIMRAAGLNAASLGQEYSRVGAVQAAQRRGTRLFGVIEPAHARSAHGLLTPEPGYETHEQPRYSVDVDVQDAFAWSAHCTCLPGSQAFCCHAAALLYEWLARPASFASSDVPHVAAEERKAPFPGETPGGKTANETSSRQPAPRQSLNASRGLEPVGNLADILAQMGLNELRNLAREYDISTINLTKPQLVEAISAALNQTDIVRKVAASLEKLQRQLLATIILAGGTVTDEDLHGLFERFTFAQTAKLQSVVIALQSKGLLLRTSLNSSSQQRIGVGTQFIAPALIDIGWYVPVEVRAALRVPLPITPFDIARGRDDQQEPLEIRHSEPSALLADLLLVARALEGYRVEETGEKEARRVPYAAYSARSLPGATETTIIPPPAGYPTPAMLAALHTSIGSDIPADYLRYAVRLLRLADILYKDEGGSANLRALPNAASLLLGPARGEIARDLFTLWRTHPGCDELFALQEEGLQLRCRTTLANQPVLRGGELEMENSEARQLLLAAIAQAPIDQWIQFPAFARFIYRLNPLYLQKRQRLFPTPHWWIEQEEGRPLQPAQMPDWMRAEGRYLERLLRGPLHWWGLIDLAQTPDGGRLLAFRLTPAASTFLNGSEPSAPPVDQPPAHVSQPPAMTINENGEVVIDASAASWPCIERIEWFAEIAGVREGRLRYLLTPQALAGALSRGHSPSALLDLLRNYGDAGAHCIAHRVERLAASYGRVRLYTGVSLLEVADPSVMRELALTTSVEQLIVQHIPPALMILNKGGAEQLAEELRRRGQTPLLHEETQ